MRGGVLVCLAGRAVRVLVGAGTAVLAVLALGATFGRCAVLPAGVTGDETAVPRGGAVLAVPVAAPLLRAGDEVFVRAEGEERAGFRRIVAVLDSWQRRYEVDGVDGGPEREVRMPPTAWRAVAVVPHAGRALALTAGLPQSGALVAAGVLLVASARVGPPSVRRRAGAPSIGSIRWHPKILSSRS